MTARTMSLAVTPSPSSAPDVDGHGAEGLERQRLGRQDVLHLRRADTEGERAEGAGVDVWLSPHTTVMPGWVRPSCGPTTWTMPCSTSPIGYSRIPNSSQLRRSVSTCTFETGSVIGPGVVGTLWSSVEGQVRTPDRPSGESQTVERLGLVTSCRR